MLIINLVIHIHNQSLTNINKNYIASQVQTKWLTIILTKKWLIKLNKENHI